MFDDPLKLPMQQMLNQIATEAVVAHMKEAGKALPCSVLDVNGSFVQIQFEVSSAVAVLPKIWLPKAESQWIRIPTQKGDYGITVPADAYLTAITGQSETPASLDARPGNLSALVFIPVANKNFPQVDAKTAYISGPSGVLLQTSDGKSAIQISENNITLTCGGKNITISSGGVTIDGIEFDSHVHPGVKAGPDTTGGPQ